MWRKLYLKKSNNINRNLIFRMWYIVENNANTDFKLLSNRNREKGVVLLGFIIKLYEFFSNHRHVYILIKL